MKKPGVVAYIESPYQILGAYEYGMQHNVHVDWIIRKSHPLNNSQIRLTLDYLEIDKNHVRLMPEISSKSALIWVMLLLRITFRRVLLGDPGSKVGRLFLRKIIIDDGTYNIQYIRKFPRKEYWTIFDSRAQNNFDYLNLKQKLNSVKLQESDDVFFIGQPLSELNILSEQKYLGVIESMSKKNRIIYFPHRRESKEKIRQLSVSVHHSDVPLELELLNIGKRPKLIVGFYSTALYSLKLLYGINSCCIKVATGNKDIDDIYYFFEKNGLKVCVV